MQPGAPRSLAQRTQRDQDQKKKTGDDGMSLNRRASVYVCYGWKHESIRTMMRSYARAEANDSVSAIAKPRCVDEGLWEDWSSGLLLLCGAVTGYPKSVLRSRKLSRYH